MAVIERLKKHILVDGFHVVADTEKSEGSYIVDRETGKRYLDCYSQFASQPLGWNHPSLKARAKEIKQTVLHKLANSDMYSAFYADFVDTFSTITPDFKYYFFIDGGALAVENALKAAFDWKCRLDPRHQKTDGQLLDVVHMKEAFHGRSGYTMSLTNTGALKTKWYPKFQWTRVKNPKMTFPETKGLESREHFSLSEIEMALEKRNVAAIIFETIQGEGGDNQFRPEYFKAVRELADKYEALFILDEVQTGMGLTGRWWAYEHYGIVPDIITFGKKTQVCGFCAADRLDKASAHVFTESGRINSTWGGNIVDMARSKVIIEIMQSENLVENAAVVGNEFLVKLQTLSAARTEITNVRGKGLMLAFDLPTTERRDFVMNKMHENMLALKSGSRSIRFRPCLTFSSQDVDQAINYIEQALS